MLKWLLVIGVVSFVWIFFIKKRPIAAKTADTNRNNKRKKYDEDEMVACVKCETYVSLNEALIRDGVYYCSKECME